MRYVIPRDWNTPPDWSRPEDDYTDEELAELKQAYEDWLVEQELDKLNDKEY
jgi:hypothetical protein